jgi:hypothetical protein
MSGRSERNEKALNSSKHDRRMQGMMQISFDKYQNKPTRKKLCSKRSADSDRYPALVHARLLSEF